MIRQNENYIRIVSNRSTPECVYYSVDKDKITNEIIVTARTLQAVFDPETPPDVLKDYLCYRILNLAEDWSMDLQTSFGPMVRNFNPRDPVHIDHLQMMLKVVRYIKTMTHYDCTAQSM